MHKCGEIREPLTETPAKDEDSALLAPSGLRRATGPDLEVDRQDRTGVCACVFCMHMCAWMCVCCGFLRAYVLCV